MLAVNQEAPPNINKIMKYLPDWKQRVFTYGSTLYNPNGLPLDTAIMKHEERHAHQQSSYKAHGIKTLIDPSARIKEWWDRYLTNWAFRLSQEISAYQAQYREYAEKITSEKDKQKLAEALARQLCQVDMDRNLISLKDATNAIRSKKDYNFRV